MGCCQTAPLACAEKLLCEAEFRLNFSKISSVEFDKLLYRFSSSNKISLAQLTEICSKCEIDLSNHLTKGFLNEFLDITSRLYDVKPLSTLGVLLGQGSSEEKLRVLFRNYDENHNLMLSYSEIQQLMTDICLISLCYIPAFASRCFHDTEHVVLNEYKIKLGFMRTAIVNHYSSILFENYNKQTDEISIDDFVRILRIKKADYTLNTSDFRKNTLRILRSITKAVDAANYVLDKSNEDSPKVYKALVRINTAREFKIS